MQSFFRPPGVQHARLKCHIRGRERDATSRQFRKKKKRGWGVGKQLAVRANYEKRTTRNVRYGIFLDPFLSQLYFLPTKSNKFDKLIKRSLLYIVFFASVCGCSTQPAKERLFLPPLPPCQDVMRGVGGGRERRR